MSATAASTGFARALRAHRKSPRTIALYVNTLLHLEHWLTEYGCTPANAPLETLLDYSDTLPFTYASRQRLINTYKAYWKLVLKRQDPCPAESIRCPHRPPQVYRGLAGPEEARALIKQASKWGIQAIAACSLLYFTAMRCDEVASLLRSADRGDILHVMGKGSRERDLPIVPELREALDELTVELNGSRWFFPGRYGDTHISTNTVLTWVKLAGAAAGLGKVTPHMLRYTAGATMHDESGDLRGTAEFLGHSPNSLSVTAGYTRTRLAQKWKLARTL